MSVLIVRTYEHERLKLASELIESGQWVRFDGYELRLARGEVLIVAILTGYPPTQSRSASLRKEYSEAVDSLLSGFTEFSALRPLQRVYGVIAD